MKKNHKGQAKKNSLIKAVKAVLDDPLKLWQSLFF